MARDRPRGFLKYQAGPPVLPPELDGLIADPEDTAPAGMVLPEGEFLIVGDAGRKWERGTGRHIGDVPYFSQWEDPDMTDAVLVEGPLAALRRDSRWQGSGADTIEEYARWAGHICGMACLKMMVAAKFRKTVPTIHLARRCSSYGGYVVNPENHEIRGLIYAPFVTFIKQEFGLDAEVVTKVTAADLPAILDSSSFFIASVHPAIRTPSVPPPSKGGHLVLCMRALEGKLVFHNPSGHTDASRRYVTLPVDVFDAFFAGRGVAVA